jgi:hypothetical protein
VESASDGRMDGFMADDSHRHPRNDDSFLIHAQIHRALCGDRMAIRALAERILGYRPLVYRNLKQRCRGPAEAASWLDDCMQDLLVRMLYVGKRTGKPDVKPIVMMYRPTRGTFPGFMKIVVLRYVLRWVERQHRNSLDGEPPERADDRHFFAELDRALFADAVLNLLYAEFRPRDRSLFKRLLVDQETRHAAAEAEGMHVDAVHQWYARTKKRAGELAREFESSVKNGPGQGK